MIGQVYATWNFFSRGPIEFEIFCLLDTVITVTELGSRRDTHIRNPQGLLYKNHVKTRHRASDTPTLNQEKASGVWCGGGGGVVVSSERI